MLTSRQRAFLRSKANKIDTIIQIGKGDISDNLILQVGGALRKRELIKLRVLENSEFSAREAAEKISDATASEVVQVIGSRFVLYCANPEIPEKRRIILP